MVHRGRTRLLSVAACLVVAATAVTLWLSEASGAGTDRCLQFSRASVARLDADAGPSAGPRVVVIGDSYSVGLGLERPADSWPVRLPGRVHVAGFSGSGFSAQASPCGQVSYADRAPAAVRGGADLVVVEGGLNDWDRSDAEIAAGFRGVVAALHAAGLGDVPLLVVGPAPAPARVTEVPRVDAALAGLAARHDAAYLSMARLELPYLPDRLHLTAAGHQQFGDVVAARVAALSR